MVCQNPWMNSKNFTWNILDTLYYYDVCNWNSKGVFEYLCDSFVLVWSNIWFHSELHHNFFDFIWLEWWNYWWNICFCLICKFKKTCNLSLDGKKYFSNLEVDFKVFVNNSMRCLGHGSIFYPEKKKRVYWHQHFYIWRVFLVFFMQTTLLLWLEFSFLV